MDYYREAIVKAKATLDDRSSIGRASRSAPSVSDAANHTQVPTLRKVELRPKHLERSRIISFGMSDEKHVAFNLLRTRVRSVLRDNKWRSIAITSPRPRCGKTTVALNLAFSFARAPDTSVVLVDLDLKKPGVAKALGVEVKGSIGQFLRGESTPEDCFIEISPNLRVGLNSDRSPDSSELIQGPKMQELTEYIASAMSPDIILFDLPPMYGADDALAFLPQVDGVLLVAASRTTSVQDARDCEAQITQQGKLVGIALNKSDTVEREYY